MRNVQPYPKYDKMSCPMSVIRNELRLIVVMYRLSSMIHILIFEWNKPLTFLDRHLCLKIKHIYHFFKPRFSQINLSLAY